MPREVGRIESLSVCLPLRLVDSKPESWLGCHQRQELSLILAGRSSSGTKSPWGERRPREVSSKAYKARWENFSVGKASFPAWRTRTRPGPKRGRAAVEIKWGGLAGVGPGGYDVCSQVSEVGSGPSWRVHRLSKWAPSRGEQALAHHDPWATSSSCLVFLGLFLTFFYWGITQNPHNIKWTILK